VTVPSGLYLQGNSVGDDQVKLFVGLGNPGAKYAGNRHNIGFMALDRIAADHGFSPWRKAFQGLVSEGRLGTEKVALLKPETFMNLSGQSVQAALAFWKLPLADVTVFHDELDLAPGKLRLKQGGGHAGHNGLRSIHGHLGEAYDRVRLGIGHPGHKDAVAAYVLHDFAKADQDWLDDLLRGISEGAPALAMGDGQKFMNAVSLRTAPPRSSTGTKAEASAANSAATGPAPRPAPATEPPQDSRSAMQRLMDKFR
jgi:PTH1 family peptidyl-tRNA hydrolase